MKYAQATNFGVGFITHEDRAVGHMSGHAGDIYAVSDDHAYWIARVNGVDKTLEEAQTIALSASQSSWDDNNIEGETIEAKVARLGPRPTSVDLPV
jgi:hypothetical protein